MNEHKPNVPKLRFPEFREAGAWDEKPLGNIANFYKGKGLPKSAITANGRKLCIHYGELFTQYSEVIETIKSRTDLTKNCFLSAKNDVLMPTSDVTPKGLAKSCCIKSDGIILGGDILIIRTDKTVINGEFLARLIRYLEQKVLQLVTGSTVFHLYASSLEKLTIYVPQIKEQAKIADCLASLDGLIEGEVQKLAGLRAHKKGVMQQLFPVAGKTTPTHRFPEFQNAPLWQEKPLGEIYLFRVTNSFSRAKLNYEKGLVKNIHYGDIHTKFSTLFDIEKEKVPFINSSQPIGRIKPENYCIEGDIIFADASEDLNDVGKSIEIVNLNNEKLLSGLHTLLARQRKSELVIGFGGYLFKSNSIREQIQREAQGAKVLGISGKRLSNINICFPKDTNEQQKIADCLTSLDELITAQAQKIDHLKAHKKGVMQQLFPAAKGAA